MDPGSSIVDLSVPLFKNRDVIQETDDGENEEIPTSILVLHSSQDSGQKYEEQKQQSWVELLRDNPFASDQLNGSENSQPTETIENRFSLNPRQ